MNTKFRYFSFHLLDKSRFSRINLLIKSSYINQFKRVLRTVNSPNCGDFATQLGPIETS